MFASKLYQTIVRKATEIVINSLKVALTILLPHFDDLYLHHRTTELFKVTSYFSCVLSTVPISATIKYNQLHHIQPS